MATASKERERSLLGGIVLPDSDYVISQLDFQIRKSRSVSTTAFLKMVGEEEFDAAGLPAPDYVIS